MEKEKVSNFNWIFRFLLIKFAVTACIRADNNFFFYYFCFRYIFLPGPCKVYAQDWLHSMNIKVEYIYVHPN